ncbi:MAG: hypothetical protein V8Q40_11920 [Anaerosacchariphilus sp.]
MSKNTLYLECYEGITGEMVLGALRGSWRKCRNRGESTRNFPEKVITR